MSSDLWTAVAADMGGLLTLSGVIYQVRKSAKNKGERNADQTVAEKTAEKITAEKADIVDETRSRLLKDINEALEAKKKELENTEKQLSDAKIELQKAERLIVGLREIIAEKDQQIAMYHRQMRRIVRRAEVLEHWIEDNMSRFEQLGIDSLPEDVFGDRRLGMPVLDADPELDPDAEPEPS